MNINIAPISKISDLSVELDPNKDIRNVMLHLNSEVGEMNDWINRPWRQKEDFVGECADSIICIVDVLLMHYRAKGIDNPLFVIDDLNKQIELKTEKWKSQIIE